ncbi:MAG: hypothetical protein IPL63_03645 [Saprospiraceae bacterium]|nr:hypothetical protein [Saprospiraceae bacterium]
MKQIQTSNTNSAGSTQQKIRNEHITLGNLFSPAYRLLFKQEPNLIFNHGFEAYQPYKYTFQNYRFYTSKQPLTEVFFSQFSNQLNFSAGAKVAIPFANGWNFSLDYFRVSQQGFYRSQSVKSTNLTTGMKYQSNKDRYSFIISYIQHVQDEKNNGGIKNESDLISFPLRGSVPTNIENAQTRHQSRTYSIVQYLRLAGNQKWKLFIHNTINFEPSYFKYAHATKAKTPRTTGRFYLMSGESEDTLTLITQWSIYLSMVKTIPN